jgi:hypothetical protein
VRSGRNALVAMVVAVGLAAPALAGSFELTVLGGFRMGGAFEDSSTAESRRLDAGPSFGLAFGFPLEADRTLEVVWTHQEGRVAGTSAGSGPVDLDLDTLGIGGTYEWSHGAWKPFVSGTVGFTILSPDQPGLDREALLSGTLGGGVKVPISPSVDLRFEGRGVAMLATGSAAGVCGGGGCVLAYSGAGIFQLEFLAGVGWSF